VPDHVFRSSLNGRADIKHHFKFCRTDDSDNLWRDYAPSDNIACAFALVRADAKPLR